MDRSEKGTAVGATGGALVGAAVGGPVGAAIGAGVGGYAGHHQAGETSPTANNAPVRATPGNAASDTASPPGNSRTTDASVTMASRGDATASTAAADQARVRQTDDIPGRDAVMPRTDDAMTETAFAATHDAQTIRSLQIALRERGFDPGPIDGVWGPRTESALRRFQDARGISGSGQVDAHTIAELELDGSAQTSAAPLGTTGSPTR